MASFASYSTSHSDISTPRSISPSSSVVSGRSSHSSISSSNKRMSISSSRRISAANPMSSVDIATIEEAMRMANLDTLQGYAQNHYGEVRQYATTEYISRNQALGYQVLNEPLWNKGKLQLLSHHTRSAASPARAVSPGLKILALYASLAAAGLDKASHAPRPSAPPALRAHTSSSSSPQTLCGVVYLRRCWLYRPCRPPHCRYLPCCPRWLLTELVKASRSLPSSAYPRT